MKKTALHIDQVGYRKSDPKAAFAVGTGCSFEIIDEAAGQCVYKGEAAPGVSGDPASGDSLSKLDFSGLSRKGTYRIRLDGEPAASVFSVGDRPYAKLTEALLKGLYYQRCGCELPGEFAGPWKHGPCHMSRGSLVGDPSETLDVSGGWHDAGDYGKYVVPGAVTVAMMLLAYEHMPEVFGDSSGIPESGNGIPDILDEARWELEWMLKMQRVDGGVYHKATSRNFPGFIMPEDDRLEIAVCPVSAAATADLCASAAMASRFYLPYDAGFSHRLIDAAGRAWAWLLDNPDAGGFKNPKGVTTGEYGDRDVRDERLWAAASLYRATKDESLARMLLDMLAKWPDADKIGLGWAQVGGFAAIEVLFMDGADPELVEAMKGPFLAEAGRLTSIAASDGYGIPMLPKDYVWGSTMVLMNRAAHLLLAGKLTGTGDYEPTALDCLHWLLGRNPMGVCYVTGFGSVPVMHPHHRPSGADGVEAPVPGLVSGGPDRNRSDAEARRALPADIPPAKAYLDNVESYSTNEIAIYWNSPALFAAAWFSR